MDVKDQMETVVASSTTILVDYFASSPSSSRDYGFASIKAFRVSMANQLLSLLTSLRTTYLSGDRGAAPAALHLGKTRALYEYVRVGLGVKMHGTENLLRFESGLGRSEVDGADVSIGGMISRIYESIRDGGMVDVVRGLFGDSVKKNGV
jgi:phenylalanine ammonia-lyase